MIDFTDEQKLAQRMLRQWADKELAPLVPRLERGELLRYEPMRKLMQTVGMDEMVRAAFQKPDEAAPREGGRERPGADPALMAIVSMELSRVCPGFALAMGASLGLAGGAIMSKGTPAQRRRWALPILTGEK